MTIIDQPFNSNPSCFGFCNGGTEISHQQSSSFINSELRLPTISQNNTGLTSSDDQQKTKEIDTLLSQALSNLTFEERQEQQEVLHGVDNKISEDRTSIEAGLKELDDQLLKSKKGTVYELAETLNPEYVSSRDFRLMFLRTDRYDAKDAAKRMLRFFEVKQKLFGTSKLVKDITLDDLDEDDIACMKTGAIQTTGRDLSGRQVFIQIPGLTKFKTLENELRALYYINMSVMKSEETQIRGCAWVVYSIGNDFKGRHSGGSGDTQCASLQMTVPPYKASVHFVLDSVPHFVTHGISMAIKVLPSKMRARMKLHYGSHVECQYQLSTFGILPGLMPFTQGTNEINMARHFEWFNSHLVAEQGGSSSIEPEGMISTPTSNDVVCVGHKKCTHLGNQYLLVLVKEYSEAYANAKTNASKRQVVAEIVGKIHDSGGRFVKPCVNGSNEGWEGITDAETQTKIMQAFRNFRRRRDCATQKKTVSGRLIEGEPLPADVVFGRLQEEQRNPGNDLLRRLVKEHSEEYESLDRGMKMRLAETIIQRIKDQGGRFLHPALEAGRWLEIPNDAVRARVSKNFRNIRRPGKN